MMRVVENSPDHLRLSNAHSFWAKWGFVLAIVLAILFGIFIAAKVIRPVCWPAVALGILTLFLLIRELPRNFDKEFWFERKDSQLKVIERPWLGSPRQDNYPLSDINDVRVVSRKNPRRIRGYYPGIEDDMEAEAKASINKPTYNTEVYFKSERTLIVGWDLENEEARELATLITEFLGLTLNHTSRS